ncbi:MAG TPA: hypothetical protein VG838_13355 [Opitutaceae bacterium]|nr:hypothetical protein [Lacunisphaera sp.]HWA10427.1 hypothetical protein [Opitutaceae bacterium]
MRPSILIGFLAVLAGCASPKTVVSQASAPAPVVDAKAERKAVETRYDVRGYREAASPRIRHEAHAVYRRTLVPASAEPAETAPRSVFAPASVAPLPASEELNAELEKQKAITAQMQSMQVSMADTQAKMQAQYAQLLKQSGEALRLRERLEIERSQNRANTGPAPDSVAATGDSRTTQAKW